MNEKVLSILQDDNDTGSLEVRVVTQRGFKPVANAEVIISVTGTEEELFRLRTDDSGIAEKVILNTPPLQYSLQPNSLQPYADYTIQVSASGYEPVAISNVQILPDSLAVLEVKLFSTEEVSTGRVSDIAPHTLYFKYPPKIPEDEIKPISETGEIVLTQVVIPEYIVVHDGPPQDSSAQNYYVPYKDYIKNVASSEIYATWPEETIKANILAIMSFTLNRVYTEWYRNKGYNFTITSSTAYDHKWIPDRNVFENISELVDELFTSYLSRPNVRQPILTQYCDGNRTSCPGWMTQWGSKTLGDQNYTAIEILRYFYGDSIYINNAETVSGIPVSWPGESLQIGSRGEDVSIIQEQLNAISKNYPAIPSISIDGIYGINTENAVRTFQEIFDLPATGVVDFRTWYKISAIYVAVTRIAEL